MPLRHHDAGGVFDGQKRADQVHRQNLGPESGCYFVKAGCTTADAGVGVDNVQTAKMARCTLNKRFNIGFVRGVFLERDGPPATFCDGGYGVLHAG